MARTTIKQLKRDAHNAATCSTGHLPGRCPPCLATYVRYLLNSGTIVSTTRQSANAASVALMSAAKLSAKARTLARYSSTARSWPAMPLARLSTRHTAA